MSWRGGREREREGEKEEKEKEKEREGRQEREEREREVTSLFRPSNFYLSASIVKSGVHRRLQRKEREKTEEKLQESKEMMRASVAGEQVEKRAQKRLTRKKKKLFLLFFLLVPLACFYSSTSKKTLRPAQLPSATFSRFPTMAAAFVTSGESSPFSVESRSRGRRRERTGGACPDALSPSCRFNDSSSSPLLCSKPMTLQPEPLRRCARTSTRRDPLGLRRRAARRARPQLRARFLC